MLGDVRDQVARAGDRLAERDALIVRRAVLLAQMNRKVQEQRGLDLQAQRLKRERAERNRNGFFQSLRTLFSRRLHQARMKADNEYRALEEAQNELSAALGQVQTSLADVAGRLHAYENARTEFADLAARRRDELAAVDPALPAPLGDVTDEWHSVTEELERIDCAYCCGADTIKSLKEMARVLSASGAKLINVRSRNPAARVIGQAISAACNSVATAGNLEPVRRVRDGLKELETHLTDVRWDGPQTYDRTVCELMASLNLSAASMDDRWARDAAGRPALAAVLAKQVQGILNALDEKRLELASRLGRLSADYTRLLLAEPTAVQSVP